MKRKENKLYRYYNFNAGRHGEVFALCKKHESTLVEAPNGGASVAENIGRGQIPCNRCNL